MLLDREDVELLAAIDAVVMAEIAEVLEDIEGPVDRRRRRRRIDRAAALDELRTGDVTGGPRQDVDKRPALGRPAEAAGV